MAVGMASPALADANAGGHAADSPGILSGNVIQVPVHVPINVCGNTISVIGVFNPAIGNKCVNGSWGDNDGPPHFDQ
ncbi:chaplin [Streptomyces sp. NPDC002896]|uniref:chaplin n=1 Tax=Streptomyces sp. NPDC002896 TaxID=3154438 RepID=UPI00332CCD50